MKNLPVLCFFALFLSCSSSHYTPKTYKASQLTFGSSGGVTGMIREYQLLDNGQLFMSTGVDYELKELPPVAKSETKKLFGTAGELMPDTLKFIHPGNMTYYVILKKKSGTITVKWGESGLRAPKGVKEFYDHAISVVQHK